jgi:hypothetical protein
MDFTQPVSFREAVKQLAAKKVMPTELTSAELAQLNREVMRTSFTSAQTTIEGLLDRYKAGIESIVNPEQVLREGAEQTVTEGHNPATLRTFIKDYLNSISYKPAEGEEGTLKDLSSDKRINLVVKTNVQLAHGAGRFIQENADPDVVDLWPALEFVRFEDRKEPRDWEHRWRIAARTVGDVDAARCLEMEGRMCALKDSEIWQALGDGAGGYVDTLGNPYPPFAFNSGMWTEEVSREEAEGLGLLDKGEKAEPADFDLASLFGLAA